MCLLAVASAPLFEDPSGSPCSSQGQTSRTEGVNNVQETIFEENDPVCMPFLGKTMYYVPKKNLKGRPLNVF